MLPKPIYFQGKQFIEVETKKPTAAVLADTHELVENGNWYDALIVFLTGCITQIEDITETLQIKKLVKKMPYKTADWLTLQILIDVNNGDDGVEAIYNCPRGNCDGKIICEKTEDSDTRDFLLDLENKIDNSEFVNYTFKQPYNVEAVMNENIKQVKEIKLRFPTLGDASVAMQKSGSKNHIKLQNAILAESLISVNGYVLEDKEKRKFARLIVESIPDLQDTVNIISLVSDYGIKPQVEKTCLKCGKTWQATVPTYNFFDFAPRLEQPQTMERDQLIGGAG